MRTSCLLTFAAAYVAFAITPAHAINKCVGADGRVVYSDTACAAGEKQSDLKVPSKVSTGVDIKRDVLQEPPTDDQAKTCLEAWRPTMRDPRGLYSQRAVLRLSTNRARPEQKPWKEVVLEAHATNGFGGYTDVRLVCRLTQSGSIDIEALETLKTLQRVVGHLD